MSPQLAALDIDFVKNSTMSVIESKISGTGRDDKDDAFFVADLSDVVRKHRLWTQQLPRVHPYYAVKCNEDPGVLGTLAELGTGFDCASKAEIQKILSMKVSAERIIYANPCKQGSHIKYAAKHGVARMTFDNEVELHKVKAIYPNAELVLRLLPPDDNKAQCQLGMKYGCPPKQVPHLLTVAKELGLNVIGISFHVGSGCYDASAFSSAVVSARVAFDHGLEAGYNFSLLDIGGGFPGQDTESISFQQICAQLRPALDRHFPQGCGVDIIAEPGRFFAASAFTLVVNIIAKRAVARDRNDCDDVTADDQPTFMYYVNDGVYGSFNCLLYDHATVQASVLERHVGQFEYTSSVWGPTCDGLDCILSSVCLPELELGDWLVFRDMGAYTICAASGFNGMPKPHCYYIVQEDLLWQEKCPKSYTMMKYLCGTPESGTLRREAPRRAVSEA